jgi:hypothetical protein
VYANDSGVSGTAQVTVTAGALVSLALDPANGSYAPGSAVTILLTAADAQGNPALPANTTWAHPPAAVTFQNATRLSLQLPATPGAFAVTATVGAVTAAANLTITGDVPGTAAALDLALPLLGLLAAAALILVALLWRRRGKRPEAGGGAHPSNGEDGALPPDGSDSGTGTDSQPTSGEDLPGTGDAPPGDAGEASP